MPSPSQRSASNGGNGTGTDVTVTAPAGIANDDILLAVLYREGGTWTLPSGWAQLYDIADFNANATITVAWKRAASESGNYTFNLSASVWRIITMVAIQGAVATGSPFDGSGTDAPNSASIVATGISPTTTNTLIVFLFANFQGVPITASSSGMGLRVALGGCEIWDVAQAASGASGNKTFTQTGIPAGDWASILLAVASTAPGAAAPPPSLMLLGVG